MDIQQHFNNVMQGNKALKQLTDLKVRTPEDVQTLMNQYGQTMQFLYENGFQLYDMWRPIQDRIIVFANPPTPHDKKIVTLFQKMKQFAQMNNMPELSEAVTSSAYWYWKNIETKNQPSGSSTQSPAQYGIDTTDPVVKKIEQRQKRAKYIQWGVVTVSLLGGGFLLYKAFFSKSEPQTPSRPAKRKNPRRSTVDRKRVRSYRRNQKKTPIITKKTMGRPSSLANYRKNFEAEKKRKATKKVTKRNPKSKLRLKKR